MTFISTAISLIMYTRLTFFWSSRLRQFSFPMYLTRRYSDFYLMMSACRSQRRHRGSGRRATRVLLNELSSTLYTCTLVSIVLGVGSIEAGLISIEFSLSLGSTSVHCDNWYYHGYCSCAPTKNQRNISR